MKKMLINIFVFFIPYVLTAQETFFSPNGNLGIGTTNPKAKLDVVNGDNSYGSILATATESAFSLYTKTYSTRPASIESFRLGLKHNDDLKNGYISFYRGDNTYGGWLGFSTNGVERMSIDRNGNVGIGTVNPQVKLDVNGGAIVGSLAIKGSDLVLGADDGRPRGNAIYQRALVHGDHYDALIINYEGDFEGGTYIGGYRTVVTGKLGIGVNNPDEALTVNGKIHARDIKIDQNIPADYVFQKYYTGISNLKPEYKMPSLKEVESFIKENHHLPDVPSAEKIKENGLFLGEMSNLLLQKIEELTLYSIEQQKLIESLSRRLEDLEKPKN